MRFHLSRSLFSLCLSTAILSSGIITSTRECMAQDARLQPSPTRMGGLMLAEVAVQPAIIAQPPASSGPSQLPGQELSSANSTRSNVDAQPSTNGTQSTQGSQQAGSNNALTPLQNRQLALPVQVVDLSVADLGTGILPESAADKQDKQTQLMRAAAFKCVHWHPSNICHYPLRFEETMLERHGHVRFGCWQPLASGVRFFATLPMLPYLNTLRPAHEPVYALGTYRPGSCAPLLRDSIPYDKHAAVVEALSLAGFFWAMPM